MAWDDEEDTTTYLVVVNHEEQYSIWPDYKEIPNGWRAVGKSGPKQECYQPELTKYKQTEPYKIVVCSNCNRS